MPQSDNAPTFEEIGCFYDTSAMDLATAPVCDGTMNAEVSSCRRCCLWLPMRLAGMKFLVLRKHVADTFLMEICHPLTSLER